ncbi:MAG: sigma-70 family RNA polymerase sigma factor, partial [Acetatifactor sp.]|nr:sigma-70 family RNA polymerase sigma factor [Acetatifactor sp.]
ADGRMEPLERRDGNGNSYNILEKVEADMSDSDPARQAQERWRREQLRSRMKELPEQYRLVIHLYYYEELSTEEIARLLHRRAATVRTQLVRARQQLKVILESCGYTETADLE